MNLTIEKLSYSSRPWRILWDGLELPYAYYSTLSNAQKALEWLEGQRLPWHLDYGSWPQRDQYRLSQWLSRQPAAILRSEVLAEQGRARIL